MLIYGFGRPYNFWARASKSEFCSFDNAYKHLILAKL